MADAVIHEFPRGRRQAPWANLDRPAEMELLLALIAALRERSGGNGLGEAIVAKIGHAMDKDGDTAALRGALNELCSGAYRAEAV